MFANKYVRRRPNWNMYYIWAFERVLLLSLEKEHARDLSIEMMSVTFHIHQAIWITRTHELSLKYAVYLWSFIQQYSLSLEKKNA